MRYGTKEPARARARADQARELHERNIVGRRCHYVVFPSSRESPPRRAGLESSFPRAAGLRGRVIASSETPIAITPGTWMRRSSSREIIAPSVACGRAITVERTRVGYVTLGLRDRDFLAHRDCDGRMNMDIKRIGTAKDIFAAHERYIYYSRLEQTPCKLRRSSRFDGDTIPGKISVNIMRMTKINKQTVSACEKKNERY